MPRPLCTTADAAMPRLLRTPADKSTALTALHDSRQKQCPACFARQRTKSNAPARFARQPTQLRLAFGRHALSHVQRRRCGRVHMLTHLA